MKLYNYYFFFIYRLVKMLEKSMNGQDMSSMISITLMSFIQGLNLICVFDSKFQTRFSFMPFVILLPLNFIYFFSFGRPKSILIKFSYETTPVSYDILIVLYLVVSLIAFILR